MIMFIAHCISTPPLSAVICSVHLQAKLTEQIVTVIIIMGIQRCVLSMIKQGGHPDGKCPLSDCYFEPWYCNYCDMYTTRVFLITISLSHDLFCLD